jgi:hypothetical protein
MGPRVALPGNRGERFQRSGTGASHVEPPARTRPTPAHPRLRLPRPRFALLQRCAHPGMDPPLISPCCLDSAADPRLTLHPPSRNDRSSAAVGFAEHPGARGATGPVAVDRRGNVMHSHRWASGARCSWGDVGGSRAEPGRGWLAGRCPSFQAAADGRLWSTEFWGVNCRSGVFSGEQVALDPGDAVRGRARIEYTRGRHGQASGCHSTSGTG